MRGASNSATGGVAEAQTPAHHVSPSATKILCDKMRLDPPLQDTLQIRRAGMHPSPARPHETERKLEKQRILKQNVAMILVLTGVGIVTQQIAATKHARHHGVTIKKNGVPMSPLTRLLKLNRPRSSSPSLSPSPPRLTNGRLDLKCVTQPRETFGNGGKRIFLSFEFE